ncbi:MAG: S9 family peptidase [Spirochaetota bacterium]
MSDAHQSHQAPDEEALRRYLAATSAMGPAWAPDGRALAFVWNDSGSYQVYVARLGEGGGPAADAGDGIAATRVSDGPDRSTDPRFLSTGEIVYSSDVGGNENFQLVLAVEEGTAWTSRTLTSDEGAKYRLAGLADDEILFVGNDVDRARFTLYAQRLPIGTWKPEPLFTPERGVVQKVRRLGDGSVLVEIAYGNMHQELLLLGDGASPGAPEGRSDPPRSLTAPLDGGEEVRWELLRETQDGRLLVATDLDSDRMRPVLLGLDGRVATIGSIEAMEQGEFASVAYRDAEPGAVLEFNVEGYSRVYRLGACLADARLDRVELPIDGVVVSGDARTSRVGLALSPEADRIAVALGGPRDVANVWLAPFEPKTGSGSRWVRLTGAEVPGVDPRELAGAALARFESFDGESIPYFTVLPPATAGTEDGGRIPGSAAPPDGHPAVLMIHGGPEAQARPSFNNVTQFLAAAGFAVVVPNIRGSAGYGRRYLDLDNRERRLDSIRDIAELARHLDRSDERVDGSRLAIMGGSYGGFAVLSAMTEYPELWKAGVDIVGISNFVTFLSNTAPWRRSLRESEYGSLEDRELLERISPINRIERVAAPLLIIQGDNDERVPLSESIQMAERLEQLGRTVELMRFADEGHGVTRLENRITAYTRVAEWLREYV